MLSRFGFVQKISHTITFRLTKTAVTKVSALVILKAYSVCPSCVIAIQKRTRNHGDFQWENQNETGNLTMAIDCLVRPSSTVHYQVYVRKKLEITSDQCLKYSIVVGVLYFYSCFHFGEVKNNDQLRNTAA